MPAKEKATTKPAGEPAAKKPATAKPAAAKPAAAKPAAKPAAAKTAKPAAAKSSTSKPAAPKPAASKSAAKPAAKPAAKAATKPAAKTAAKPAAKPSTTAKPAAKPKVAAKKATGATGKKPAVRKTPSAPDLAKPSNKKAQTLQQKKRTQRPLKILIDCTNPVAHGIVEIGSFEKFLHDRFKVNRKAKAGVLRDQATITKDKSTIVITLKNPIQKKYIKHLTKRYLKKQQLRDWLRVVANARNSYELRYYNIQEAGDESESDDED